MTFKDLIKTENKIKWDDRKKTILGFIIGILLLISLCVIALFATYNNSNYVSDGKIIRHLHCDYCNDKNVIIFKWEILESYVIEVPTINEKRFLCDKCYGEALIKGLDFILGKPKYINNRPKEE